MTHARRLPAALLGLVLLAACGGPKPVTPPPTTPSPSPSASVSPSPSPSASPSAAASPLPSSSPSPVAVRVGQQGQFMIPPTIEPAPKGNAGGCNAWIDAGWTGQCGIVQVTGTGPDGAAGWIIESQASSSRAGTKAWRVMALITNGTEPVWHIRLSASDAGGAWSNVSMRSEPLEANGQPQLVFGFRLLGGRDTLAYDVVHFPGYGVDPEVVLHRELGHGSAVLSSGRITEYAGAYPIGAPDCCPAYYQESVVTFQDMHFYATPTAQVHTPPAGDFP